METRWRRLGEVALALALLSAGCREPKRLEGVETMAWFDRSALEFGEVPVGEWREAQVRVSNVGRVPFRAVEALQLEGNPSFLFELDAGRIGPGDSRLVTVWFRPLEEGELKDTLLVTTDASKDGERPVSLAGVGTPAPVRVHPELLDFETLEVDSERLLSLTVENPIDLPLVISIAGDAEPFETDAVVLPPHSVQEVRARYLPLDSRRSEAAVEVRACPRCTPATVRLLGNAVPTAFSFEPAPVPFEPVPVHERTRSKTRATNVTWRPVSIRELLTTDEAFALLTDPTGQTIAPGQSVELEVEFWARTSGTSMAAMSLGYHSDRERASEVVLDGRGGRPQLAIAPVAIDFGEVPVGSKVERVVRLSNAGTLGPLHFKGLRAEGDADSFGASVPFRGTQTLSWIAGTAWPALKAADLPIQPGGDSLDLRIAFQPMRGGALQAALVFESDDLFHPERRIVLTGSSQDIGPCTFQVLPGEKLDFGKLKPGRGAVLGFRFENTGLNPCAVKDIHLSANGGGAFWMPGGALAGGVVYRDDSFAAMIAFKPPAAGRYVGELSITVNSPRTPVFRLPIEGVGAPTCLAATPPYVDFGPVRYDCTPTPRRTTVSNTCPYSVTVREIRIGPGTSDQFSIVKAPSFPLSLSPGAGFDLEATYSRTVHGQHYSPLWLSVEGEPEPLLVPLLAETNHEGLMSESFVQGTDNQLDLLFVVANSTTMGKYQQRLAAAIPGWLSSAAAQGVDLRVGVTTTGLVPRSPLCGGGAEGGEAGRLFPVDGSRARIVSSAGSGSASSLQQNLSVGHCHNLVQGLETARAALSTPLIDGSDDPRTAQPNDGNAGLLRSAARLAVVFVADEDDHSGFDVDGYVQFIRGLKGPGMAHRAAAYAIVPTDGGCSTAGPAGPRFRDTALKTGGAVLNICESSYASLLEQLTRRAAGPQADFVLSATPGDGEISVKVNGVDAAAGTFRYDPARNAIVFASGSIPAAGSTIGVRYRSVCASP